MHHADDGQRAFFEEDGLAQRIDIRAKEFFFGVLVDHDDLRVFFHIGLVKQAARFQLQPAYVEILFAHAVKRGGQVGVAVGQRAAGGGLRGGGGDVALLGNDFGVGNGQGFYPAAASVAETASGEDTDGVRTHRADVFEDFFL